MFGKRKKAQKRRNRPDVSDIAASLIAVELQQPDFDADLDADEGPFEGPAVVTEEGPEGPTNNHSEEEEPHDDWIEVDDDEPSEDQTHEGTDDSETAPTGDATPVDDAESPGAREEPAGPHEPGDEDDPEGGPDGNGNPDGDEKPDDEDSDGKKQDDAVVYKAAGSNGIDAAAINDKVQQVVNSIQGLEHLSELVSLRYNPFLEMNENDVFDGKRLQPDDLVQGFFSATGDAEAENGATAEFADNEYPSFMEVAHVPRRDQPEDMDESIDLTDLPINEIHSAVGRPEVDPPPAPPRGGARPTGHGAPLDDRDRARRTLLALSWFRRLQSHGPPACLFLFIDHCRRMEWIDESVYQWLTALANGVTTPDPDLTWADLGLDTIELTNIHEANILFLDDLFSDRLRFGERGYLKTNTGDYFEGL